jgi:2-octaprenyl-6-methoxyphenol hydroxylase
MMTTVEQRYDVAIAGGSLAGLALARALGLILGADARVIILDRRGDTTRSPAAKPDPRAFALGAASRRLLETIGIWRHVTDAACPVTRIDITDSSLHHAVRPVLLSYDNHIGSGEPASHIVPADRLRQALWAAVADTPGVSVVAPADVASFNADDGQRILLTDGRMLQASLLVAADGTASPLRRASGIKVVGHKHEQIGIVTTVAHERPHGGCAVQHFLPGGPFAILPLVGNRSCVTWTEAAERGREIMALDDAGFLVELEQRFGTRLGDLALDGPRASWPLELAVARSLVGPRFALIGDAARTLHPIAGQGLNHGLRDVAALAECVSDAMRVGLEAADVSALERYERWRRFDGASSAAAYEALNALFSNDGALLRSLRDAGIGIVDRLPVLKSLVVSEAAGMTGELPQLLLGRLP